MIENGTYTTKVKTGLGVIYDLGAGQRVPGKCGTHADENSCPRCLVINAWTERLK